MQIAGDAVAPRIFAGLPGRVRIVSRPGRESVNFARSPIEQNGGRARRLRGTRSHRQLRLKRILNAHINREPHRPAFGASRANVFIKTTLDAGECVQVNIGETQCVRGQTALRIDAAIFAFKANAAEAERQDLLLLLRRQATAQKHQTSRRV